MTNIVKIKKSDIDMTPFKVKKRLHKDFFDDDGMLKSRIRLRLLDIADDFVRSLKLNWVKPIDIVMTGSLSNYNWSEYSDVDVHIIYDFSKIYNKTEFVKDYFDAKKLDWNNSHDELTIKGFPVEISVEDVKEPAKSSGVYSLEKNKWVEEPEELDDSDLDVSKIKKFCADKMNDMDMIFAKMDKEKDRQKLENLTKELESIYDELKGLRKKGLASSDMEMSEGNIIWKVIKHAGYIDKCWDYYDKVYDRRNTIDEAVSNGDMAKKTTAYLMIGMPGSGKSTWVRNNLPDLPVVSRDIIRGYDEVGISNGVDDKKVGNKDQETLVTDIERKEIKELCEKGEDFVVDDTNTGKYRKGMVDYIRSCGARVVGIYVETDAETCKSRRDGVIPGDAMDRMFGRMIKPKAEEFDGFKVVSGNSRTVVISEGQMRDIRSRLDEIKVRDKWDLETRKNKTDLDYGTYAEICSLDPTSKGSGDNMVAGKYCNWLLSKLDVSKMSDSAYMDGVRIALEQFNDGMKRGILQRSGISGDINKFKSADELVSTMREVVGGGEQVSLSASNHMEALKGQYKIAAENQKWMVVVPMTWEAERYFGSGTEWCTVGNEDYFDRYMDEGQLYITVPKSMDNKLKMQFHFESKSFADFKDNVVSNPKYCIYSVLGDTDDLQEVFDMWNTVDDRFSAFKFLRFSDVERLLARGKDPQDVFDWCGDFNEGYAMVELNGKLNFIGTDGELLWKRPVHQWFDNCRNFIDGYASVALNREWNIIDTDGRILSPNQWFDYCYAFRNGYARVILNMNDMYIDADGNLYDKIPTSHLNESLDEAAWPGFNPHEIEKIPNFAQRVRWCNKNLGPCFGSGSARMIFEIDDDKVLKLAKNQKGIAQNEVEVDTSRFSDCVVKCFEWADDYSWVIEENCIPARKSDFKRLLSVDFNTFCDLLMYQHSMYSNRRFWRYSKLKNDDEAQELANRLYEEDEYGFVLQVMELMANYNLPFGDLTRISSYGLVKRDGVPEIVIIDSGLTDDVYEKYYMRRR